MPKATLIFEIEIIAIERGAQLNTLDHSMRKQGVKVIPCNRE
jgi:hypothetical protein